MRILFVEKQIDYEPLGLLYLSSVLRQADHEVRLAIMSEDDPVAIAQSWQPDVVGYSVYTGSQIFYRDVNLRIREAADVVSVFGGPHPTYFPEFIHEPGVDAVCLGEGEKAILGLVQSMAAGRPLTGIEGWWLKHGDSIERNPIPAPESNLDVLPFPDRHLLFERDAFTRQSGIKHFITSRGCPYDCTYCFNHALAQVYGGKGRRLRQMSVDRVIEEVKWVQDRYPMQFVVFLDDLFIVHLDWLRQLASRFPTDIGLPFFCNVRANLVTAEKMSLLRAAGCVSVGMGLETGNPIVRDQLLKRNLSDEQIVGASEIIHQAGLQLLTTNMLGLPGCALANDLETLALNHACRPAYANAFLYQPYPRTELGEYTREQGYLEGSLDDIDPSAWERSVLCFSSPGEKRQIENLNKLFAIAVEWPRLSGLIQWLAMLPPNPLFRLAYKLWKGYAIKSRIHPYHPSMREFMQTVLKFMKFA
jgi:anaerobic magnesium-protoporphyrin IX monomethyl ester cyclase